MRKRTKTEVEIRNILSEMLLRSLSAGTGADTLNLVLGYCGKASAGVAYSAYQRNPLLKELFVLKPGKALELKGKYAEYETFICRKAGDYLKFLSRVKSPTEGLLGEIQNGVGVAVMLFNEGFFFECHELLEDIWSSGHGREKGFLKGLIHTCVAFYHLEYENARGAVGYMRRSYFGLEEFRPRFLGIDVSRLLSDIDKAVKVLEKSKPRYINPEIPKIRLAK